MGGQVGPLDRRRTGGDPPDEGFPVPFPQRMEDPRSGSAGGRHGGDGGPHDPVGHLDEGGGDGGEAAHDPPRWHSGPNPVTSPPVLSTVVEWLRRSSATSAGTWR